MAISSEELNQIGQYVKENLQEWLPELISKQASEQASAPMLQWNYELEMRERIVRVEEGIKQQGLLLEKMISQMDKRFEQVDKRFEQLQEDMNRRFEQVDKRIELLQEDMNRRFEQVDKRFEQVDKRFEQLTRRIDRFMIWSFGLYVTMAGIIIGIIKFT